MPVKRRAEKRRLDPAAELKAWSMTFACGCDYFDDRPRIGVPMDSTGSRPDREAAQDAWRHLGERFLAEPQDPHLTPSWALREFGQPGEPHAG
jgi:hypothetical protein